MAKNLCLKERKPGDPYEVWANVWHVLKKWQVNDDEPYARWFCLVPEGEMGDVYVQEIKSSAVKLPDRGRL